MIKIAAVMFAALMVSGMLVGIRAWLGHESMVVMALVWILITLGQIQIKLDDKS